MKAILVALAATIFPICCFILLLGYCNTDDPSLLLGVSAFAITILSPTLIIEIGSRLTPEERVPISKQINV